VIQGLPRDLVGVWEGVDLFPYEIVEGGNPELEPESGDTWTVGAVLTPGWAPNASFAVDYYEFKLERSIGGISSWDICFDELNVQHAFCDHITRDQSGHIAMIVDTTVNKGTIETSGIDFQSNFDFDLGSARAVGSYTASVGINLIWTHLLSFKDQDSPVSTPYECAGFFGGPCRTSELSAWGGSDTTFTENRIRASMNYLAGPLDMYLGWRWVQGSTSGNWEYWCCESGEDLAIKSVDDKQYVDIGAGLAFSDHVRAHLGVNNLFDTDPPNMADNVWDNNTDTGLYDVFGRSYYLSVAMQY
jgi:outer membrane receptor protein involved in Fe transport